MRWSAYTWSHSTRVLLFRNNAGTFGGIERGHGRGPTAQQIRAQELGGFFQTRHGDPPFGGFGCGVLAQQEVCLWGLPPATTRGVSSPRNWGMHLIDSLINRLFFWSTPICVGSPNCSARLFFCAFSKKNSRPNKKNQGPFCAKKLNLSEAISDFTKKKLQESSHPNNFFMRANTY